MAAIAFDPLEFAQQLEASGMPRAQAEAVARGLTSMFVHNVDALVTRDYLDTRFSEFESHIEVKMEQRFTEVDRRFAEQDIKFARINVMLGIVLVAVVMPLLQELLGWLG